MLQRLVSKNWFRLSLIFIVSFSISLGIASLIRAIIFTPKAAEAEPNLVTTELTETSELAQTPAFISLQDAVDAWITTIGPTASVGAEFYDLDNQQIAAEYNSDLTLSSAALSELIAEYLNQKNASQEGTTTKTDETTELIEQLELSGTSSDGAYSNAQDAITFLQYLWQHDSLTISAWVKPQDALIDQSSSEIEDNMPQGLARGIPTAQVYAQTNVETLSDDSLIYSCLGFIELETENRHYAFVLFGNLTDEVAEQLGEAIERELQINHD